MMSFFNKQLSKWYFPVSLKYISLLIYVILIVTGLLAYSTDAAFLKQLQFTNFANLFVWSVWWPAIALLTVSLGRFWCLVCPVEIITSFFAKIGLRLKRPKWILSGWAITVFYIVILFFGVHLLGIDENPFYMSTYLLAIVGLSILTGLLFEKNTFCRYFCPIGYLLSLYSRFSFLGWRVKDVDICKTCKDKSCIHKDYRYNLNKKSCGVDLYPAEIRDNSTCILCAGCLKTCDHYQSNIISERPNPELQNIGFANGFFINKPLVWAELAFLFILSGHVIFEFFEEWKVSDSLMTFFPEFIIKTLSIQSDNIQKFITAFAIIALYPLFFWILPYLLLKFSDRKIQIKDYLLTYGVAFLPIVAAVHVCKSILTLFSTIPYIRNFKNDFSGINTAKEIINGNIKIINNPLVCEVFQSILVTIILVFGIYLSYKFIRKNNNLSTPNSYPIYLIPILYGGIFLLMIISWRWII